MPARASTGEPRLRDLMQRGLRGDRQSYAELLADLQVLLSRYFERRLGSAPEMVEDLVQETLLALHAKRHTYDVERLFTPWVFAIARHKLFGYLRVQGRTRTLPLDAAAASIDPANPEAGAVSADLKRLLGGLPTRQRRLVQEIKLDGDSVADVAARHGMTPGAVKVAVHRGLKGLMEKLRHED